MESHGYDVLRAGTPGRYVTARAYRTRGHNLEKTISEMLRLCSIAHPNVIRPLTLHLADGVVVVVTEHATAGGLLRHVPPGEGLAWWQSRMLFQQLALASDFCHAYGIRLRNVNPQHLLVSLDGHGMPVVKIFDFRAAKDTSWEGNTVTPQTPAPHMCPHALRPAQQGVQWCEDYAAVCDVWALAATLFYLCFGRWPFTRDQILGWATLPAEQWNDDVGVFDGVNAEAVPQDVRVFLARVFAGGRLPAEQYAAACPTLHSILDAAWFIEGLPPGARAMTQTHHEATKTLRESPLFRRLERNLMAARDPFGHGEAPAAAMLGMPAPPSDSGGGGHDSGSDASSMSGALSNGGGT